MSTDDDVELVKMCAAYQTFGRELAEKMARGDPRIFYRPEDVRPAVERSVAEKFSRLVEIADFDIPGDLLRMLECEAHRGCCERLLEFASGGSNGNFMFLLRTAPNAAACRHRLH